MSLRSRASAAGRGGGVAAVVVIAGLWLVSGWRQVRCATVIGGRMIGANVELGELQLHFVVNPVVDARLIGLWIDRYHPTWDLSSWRLRPFAFFDGNGEYIACLNLWLLFVLTVAPTAVLWRRRLRTPPGHCRKCRYDLRGVTTGVCPECGAPAKLR